MTRRANGEGSICQRTDGRWCAAIVADDPVTGKRKRTYFYGKTRTEVRKKLRGAQERAEVGAPVRDASATLGSWLAEWRDTSLAASNRRPTTKVLYATLSRKHLEASELADMPLDKIRPRHIEALVQSLRDKGLADSTVRQVYTILRGALDIAVRDGLLARNPAAALKRPAVERKEAKHLSADEVAALLKAAEGSRYHDMLALIAATGLRRGEALALRWPDVDLEAGTLRVKGTLARVEGELVVSEPKTKQSRRTLPLSPALVSLLDRHRRTQAEERLRAGNLWTDTGHVFTTETGTPIDPRNVLRAVTSAAEKAGIDGVGVHTLRHSAATAWLEAGVHLKAVSELLGHHDIAITGDCYGHVSEAASRSAVDTLSDALGL